LIRETEEITITEEREEQFIRTKTDAERELMLLAFIDGKHIGNCSLMSIAPYRRYSHRCEVAIALYKEYCGCGIGKAMLQTVLDIAKDVGYEQAELVVMAENKDAIAMYEKLGFEQFGTLPHNMKYADGSYMDAYWMMKKL
ncbi:MAG: GNAT family N-acetyltransferase, partial [Lachnospiraceae bacterium]|nr:GNAT family N-acetyltransferase [Lachnospiraceae bacterium]